MLITLSGGVGSGKTTAGREIVRVLQASSADVVMLRFQGLPCFSWLRGPLTPRTTPSSTAAPLSTDDERPVRGVGYRPKRLTLAVTLVYLARIIAFRVYRRSWPRRRTHVLNRYFYDLFVHYRLEALAERRYLRLLKALMPRPDLALLMTASPEVTAARRPLYSGEYLAALQAAYARLHTEFPELIQVSSDQSQTTRALERILTDFASQSSLTKS